MSMLDLLMVGAQNGNAGSQTYVDDVFSAYTYTGNGSTQTISNGVNLSGKGGVVWTKSRSTATDHKLVDTTRGATYGLISDTTGAQTTDTNGVTAFTSSGYSLGTDTNYNNNAATYVGWTFRKAAKFFDIVTYTGDGTSNRQISHALGISPGMVMSKITSSTGDWNVYHASATGDLVLNTTAAQTGGHSIITAVSASTFTITGVANTNGATYVAYLFAHDTSTNGIIQCGSFTTDSIGYATVNLGWEPQYVMYKRIDVTGNWCCMDAMRGLTSSPNTSNVLCTNTVSAENIDTSSQNINITSTGIGINGGVGASHTCIYLAIRRPNKPPTTGTQIYNAIARTGTGAAVTVTGVGFAPDLVIIGNRLNPNGSFFGDKLRGVKVALQAVNTNIEISSTNGTEQANFIPSYTIDGITFGGVGGTNNSGSYGYNASGETYINYFFKRAPGVFDEVCYTGTGSATTITHNLGVAPELWIVKGRSGTTEWEVGSAQLANTETMQLNSTAAKTTGATTYWNSTYPTSTVFSIGTAADVNTNAATYVAYLFATKVGISKVGSYTGNGTSQTINCGFSTGARFIMIKRTDSTGDWYVWDSVRGIVAANDPHLSLNTTAAEVTTDDSVDPDSTGFIVNQVSATNVNVNAATYIFLSFA